MNFSVQWDQRYRESTHMSVWPWSDLVSYVMRYVRPAEGSRVLELGCGAGANIPFFLSRRVNYYGIEGSQTIVEKLVESYPELRESIVAGDFTQLLPFDGAFDCIVDRASLTHNTSAAISHCLELVNEKLKPGGKFVGIDWFSTMYSEFNNGMAAEDAYTRTGYDHGAFAGTGRVHFSDKAHLLELFGKFEMKVLEHKVIQREIPEDGWQFASWNFVAEKV